MSNVLKVMKCNYCSASANYTDEWVENLKGWIEIRVTNIHDRKKQDGFVGDDPVQLRYDQYTERVVVCCPKCGGPRGRDMRPKKRPEKYYKAEDYVESMLDRENEAEVQQQNANAKE